MSVVTNLLPANTSGIETDTSGWTAGSNTTLSKSTRFYTGASSLGMTATAAGSVTATISARVAVVAGTEYTAYSYWAGVAAVAGRISTIRVDWYAAVSGGTAISSTTSAGVALPNATTWVTPPPILIATAPAGAAYASVTVSCSGLAAGATVVTDATAFGLPAAVPANLLAYNVSGVEVDTSGWGAWGNVTLSRLTTAWEGWYGLALTSVAAGEVQSGMSANVPVVPGTEYAGASAVQPIGSAGGAEFRVELRWYSAEGTYISSSPSTPWTPAGGGWTRVTAIGVAPSGAVFARLRLRAVATGAGQVWACDRMALIPAPTPSGSLLTYNVCSMEVDASGWTAISGCTVSRSTDTAWEGVASLRIDEIGTAGMDATVTMSAPVPVAPRQSYQVTPHLKLGVSAEPRKLIAGFIWYNAADEVVATTAGTWTLSAGSGWYVPPTSAVAPATAARLAVSFRIISSEIGQPAYLDDVSLVPGGLAAIPDVIPDRYGVSVALQGLTAGGYTYWGLWRVGGDGTMTAVRGSSGDLTKVAITGDVAVVEDYEAPLGVEVRYYVKLWTTTAYRSTMSLPIVVPEPHPTEIVLKDPGLPARQTTAVVSKGGQPTWTRRARQGVNPVRGRARPIIISDMRTSREGTMTLITETSEDLAAMWWLLEPGNALLIQWPSLWGETDVYVSVGDVAEAPVVEYAEYRDRTWTVPLTEVDRPIGGATGSAGRTWQSVTTEHSDYLDVLTTYASWLGVYTGVEGT
ncbi:hypothetical protein [Streptomyces fulvorobeus]|uniref:Uncharacterized protein n=1 Tax=Streptomyces fulvorobeus TaxID=284028 RepID=A0A7J0CEN2_9ACTN|nr:hypothetical protein [Streptomyces fulvorobeus]NYE44204.1 hypothetical protein [Streptomyces fulvorobeus]GFN00718.1 hypothetical protein Sfulv_55280 [Streptomyces fulvorobeus]